MPHIKIGDVSVIEGEPPDGNPYKTRGLIGPDREDALLAFRDGKTDERYTFWYAPTNGGAYRLDGPEDVDWRDMRR